jgi:hypothetical protein
VLAQERVSLNPPAEDPTVQSLDFVGIDPSWGIYLMAHDYTPPPPEVIKSGSSDTEGDVVVQSKYGNRTITAKVRAFEPPDAAAVNKIVNPSAETDLTGITKRGTATQTRVVDPLSTPLGLNLDTYVQMETSTSGAGGIWKATPTVGQKETFSVYVKATALGGTYLVAVVRTPAAATLAASAHLEAVTGEWSRLTVSFTATEAGEHEFIVWQATAGTASYCYTGGQLEVGPVATHYFDGDTPGCDWAGERNHSTSTRPAPDGTRFSRICRDITRQMDRIKRTKQGVLRRISAQGGPMYFDLRVGQFTEVPTTGDVQRKRAEYGMSFEALPGGRGPEVLLGEVEETVKPAASLTVQVPGEMPALGRLVVTDKQGIAQRLVLTGTEQTFYSAAATAETLYEAESRTPIGTSVEEALTGASGGKAIKSPSLIPAFQTVVSTQAKGGGAHLSHVGSYRLWARVWRPAAATGELTLKLSWSEGDFIGLNSGSENEASLAEGVGLGSFTLVDLGMVNPQQAASGTAQRWEGRIAAKSTTLGQFAWIDFLFLQAVTDGAAQMEGNPVPQTPDIFTGYDHFDYGSGVLTGKVAPAGGTWAGAGSANDFTTVGRLLRTAVSDVAKTGHYAILGTTEPAGLTVASWLVTEFSNLNNESRMCAIVLRYLDVNNWVKAGWEGRAATELGPAGVFTVIKKVAGVETVLATSAVYNLPVLESTTLQFVVDGEGNFSLTAEPFTTLAGTDAVLATAGTLKKGKFGIYDEWHSASASTRKYGLLEVTVPAVDAAIYASRSLELRADRSRRESADGLTWGTVANVGDYLTLPPSLSERRPARVSVKGSRNRANDAGIDDVKMQLYGTPRFLHAAPY